MLQDLQNLFGYNNKYFSQTLSSVLSAVCQREVVKFARVYQSRLLHCLLLRDAPFASIRGHSPENSNINPIAPGDFAEKRVLKPVEWFSGHCRAIKS